MSEVLSVATENEIRNFEKREKNYNKIYKKVVATEEKIQELKEKLNKRKLENKKYFWSK